MCGALEKVEGGLESTWSARPSRVVGQKLEGTSLLRATPRVVLLVVLSALMSVYSDDWNAACHHFEEGMYNMPGTSVA